MTCKIPTLIEYATFFGSIQIFNFLCINQVAFDSSLWSYAIHSNNAEMIHILESKNNTDNFISDDKTYEGIFIESIKCHHNDFANYIKDNLLNQKISNESNYSEQIFIN